MLLSTYRSKSLTKISGGRIKSARLSIVTAMLVCATLVGAPGNAFATNPEQSVGEFRSIGLGYTREQAMKDVQTVVNRYTITEFCGQDSWSVRKGYEISRRQFLEHEIVSRAQFRDMRLRAIKSAESYLDESGPAEFNQWCATQSVKAAQFFLGLMSGDMRSFEATLK